MVKRLGFPVRPQVKVLKVKKGSRFDLSAAVEATRRKRKELSKKILVEMRGKYVGAFKTGLPCNCGEATITDRATLHDTERPIVPFHAREFLIGPGPDRDPIVDVENFTVYHAYLCETCGVTYQRRVIEGKRGYTPRERRSAALRYKAKKIIELRAL